MNRSANFDSIGKLTSPVQSRNTMNATAAGMFGTKPVFSNYDENDEASEHFTSNSNSVSGQ